ncbi:GNAT family N-acetyltransferase [Aeromicrobium ginsengisoli]|uniref:GNAT family N-acetyltransferase n=1 Tax=Aeromicrobium ginsengisoli TaxID=363867 RepID=A0A5M4FJA6_9ACTN|nr:GNAT family N-acetyltransferase [Aeromicrobium ginsengisoli]KAA1400141.1 GNAT family N-acetyltransferase [Aeromicrobium ginsengisoli]
MGNDYLDMPVDPTSRDQLAAEGLRLELVDISDKQAFAAWSRAESRGFHSPVQTEAAIEQRHSYFDDRRITGVYDDSVPVPQEPVATTMVWPADLTVPGRRTVQSWAISDVTVAPTHRRRGVARALLEAELRTAQAHGAPIATLTVSESTIYGHFGFGPAALARDLTIDTRRAKWTGPRPAGRVHFVTADQLLEPGLALVERVRLTTPGQIAYDGILWDRQLGLMVDDEVAKKQRFVRYDDESGRMQGFASYTLNENPADFTQHRLDLLHLVTATDDAYAALWRFVLEMDLVSEVKAHLRPVDEPVRWMVSDFRAVKVAELDHLWIRILDVPAALEARTYATPGRLVLSVSDPFGAADGSWVLDVDDTGTPTVTPTDDPADVSLTVEELAAIYLGGASPVMLHAAGRVRGDAARLEAMFRSPVAPFLSHWF